MSDALALQFSSGACQIRVSLTDAKHPFEPKVWPLLSALGRDQVDFSDNPAVQILQNKGKAVYVGVTEEKMEQG